MNALSVIGFTEEEVQVSTITPLNDSCLNAVNNTAVVFFSLIFSAKVEMLKPSHCIIIAFLIILKALCMNPKNTMSLLIVYL